MSEEKVGTDVKTVDVKPEITAPAAEPAAAPAPAADAATTDAANGSSSKRPADEEAAMNDEAKPDLKRGKFDRNKGGNKKFQAREKHKEKGRARGQRQGGWKARKEIDEEAAMNAMAAGEAPAKKAEDGEEGNKEKRLPKKRAAVLLGYCGTGYSGMQM